MRIVEASELSDHPLTNMFLNECQGNAYMWLMPDRVTGAGFTIDYGCELLLTKLELKNANALKSDPR